MNEEYLIHFLKALAYIFGESGQLLFNRIKEVSIANWFVVACALVGFWVIMKIILKYLIMAAAGAAGTYIVTRVLMPLVAQKVGV